MEQFIRDALSPIELAAYDQGVTDAPDHALNGMTAKLAFRYFADSVSTLGPNDDSSNLYCLYWHGVSDVLETMEAARLAERDRNAWRTLANLTPVVADSIGKVQP